LIAVSNASLNSAPSPPTTTIYLNDIMSSAVAGWAVGWLPSDELFVDASGAGAIFNSAGIKQSGPALPQLRGPIQALSATSVFDAASSSIYSLSTGALIWSPGGTFIPGAIAGSRVAFVMSDQLFTEPY